MATKCVHNRCDCVNIWKWLWVYDPKTLKSKNSHFINIFPKVKCLADEAADEAVDRRVHVQHAFPMKNQKIYYNIVQTDRTEQTQEDYCTLCPSLLI